MTYSRVALLGFVAGSGFAAGVAALIALRAAYTITRGNRWYQIRHL